MADFEVGGAEDFLKLSKALKAAGEKELRKELHRGLQRAAKPLIPKARAKALAILPQRGGLARQVAKEPARVQVRTGEKTAGVRVVVGKKAGGARAANRGVIRHPVFGNRDVWVDQPVPPGWFDDTLRAGGPEARREIERAVRDMAERVVQEAR